MKEAASKAAKAVASSKVAAASKAKVPKKLRKQYGLQIDEEEDHTEDDIKGGTDEDPDEEWGHSRKQTIRAGRKNACGVELPSPPEKAREVEKQMRKIGTSFDMDE